MSVEALESATRSLEALEAVIERGVHTFVEVGRALLEIRDRRLYREAGYNEFDGYCRERWGWSRQHAYRQMDAARVVEALSPNGDTPTNEAQARELVPLLSEERAIVEVWQELRQAHGQAVTAEKVREAVGARLRRDQFLGAKFSSESAEWYTPSVYVEAARRVLGSIDLDPASSAEANRTVRAAAYFSAQDDGLAKDWPGRVWMNPPYGGLGPAFIRRLIEQYEAGITTEAICLLNAHGCDTGWFRPLWDYTLCFTYGRIEFDSPTDRTSSPPHGSVFVYLGPRPADFEREFASFGAVVERRRTA